MNFLKLCFERERARVGVARLHEERRLPVAARSAHRAARLASVGRFGSVRSVSVVASRREGRRGLSAAGAEAIHARHVVFYAADGLEASIPIEKAISDYGDTLLAYEMNGEAGAGAQRRRAAAAPFWPCRHLVVVTPLRAAARRGRAVGLVVVSSSSRRGLVNVSSSSRRVLVVVSSSRAYHATVVPNPSKLTIFDPTIGTTTS